MSFFLVGLSGVSCSGKSTTRDIFHQFEVGLGVRLDGYYRGLDGAYRHPDGTPDWEDIRSFEADAAAKALKSLRKGEVTTLRTYDRKFHRPSGTEEVDPAGPWKFVVADSLFCLEDPLYETFDLIIHLHIDEDLLLARRRERQGRGPDGEWVYSDEYHERCMRPSLARIARRAEERGVEVLDASKKNTLYVAGLVWDRIQARQG